MKKRTKGVLAAALAAAGVFLLAGLDARLLVRAYTVESGRLTGPVRLAVLTDLHACAYGEGQRELLDAVAEQSPDLVLLCGDIVDDEPRMPEERALDTVEALAAVWPTYYVTGNHEFWTGRVDEVKARLEERGAVVLAGDCVTVTAAGQTVQLCGIDDPSVGETRWREQLEAVTAALDGEHCSILMTHRPERTEDYAGRGFELVLAGHAHGGQWRLPGLLNGLFAPDQGLFPTYAGGRYALGDTTLLVSRGLARESTRLREQLEAVTAALDGEHCSILMTHRPERTEDYAGRGFELVLAGHAHGGQWRLPGLLNGLFAPDQGLFPTYAGGRYALGDTTLLVSRGLARESTRLPRFYNRPELVMVELRPGLEEFPAKKE